MMPRQRASRQGDRRAHAAAGTALVTGASSGIGAALARELAGRGHHLVLVSRRQSELDSVARDLRERGARACVLPADLAEPDAVERLLDQLAAQGCQVDVLVNSAGYFVPARLADWTIADQRRFLRVMLSSVCELTSVLALGMQTRGFGRILTVSSLQGLVPGVPGHALYGATKAFLIRFSEALHLELRGSGVHVTVLCPGLTRTPFFEINRTSERYIARTPAWAWQEADRVACEGLRALEANRSRCVPGIQNRMIAAAARLLPPPAALRLVEMEAHRFS